MSSDSILLRVQEYYDEKIRTHGPTARGVDWKSAESQQLRFAQLVRVIDSSRPFTVNDFGCGYGALLDYLKQVNIAFSTSGLIFA